MVGFHTVFREEPEYNLESAEAQTSRTEVTEALWPLSSLAGTGNRRSRLHSGSFIFLHGHV